MSSKREPSKAALSEINRGAGLVFEERDGLLWLDGEHLARFCKLTRRRFEVERVGFDKPDELACLDGVMRRGVRVAVRQGQQLRMLTRHRSQVRPSPPFQQFSVRPEYLLDKRDFEQMQARKTNSLASTPELELGARLYVIKLMETMYEVDWQLTTLSESEFRKVAYSAYLAHGELPCRLVQARASRTRQSAKRPLTFEEPVTYGQLRLGL